MSTQTSALAAGIRERQERVRETIAAAAQRAGRSAESVRLVVVTKTQPLRVVQAAIEAGARILGENYAEEAVAKMDAVRGGSSSVEWHMIGHVQSRKAKLVAQHFDLIHSLDSAELAERLNRPAAEIGRTLPVLLEFNVSGEMSKHGWSAADECTWASSWRMWDAWWSSRTSGFEGLMTMPPLSTDPEGARVHFRPAAAAARFPCRTGSLQAEWHELSMGTSADYPVAVEEGATLVRVGQAILGPRPIRSVNEFPAPGAADRPDWPTC